MSHVQYYKATEIGDRCWQIEYAFTNQEHVYCYLIEGNEFALLIDTMYGYGSLKAFCRMLTDKPIRLALTPEELKLRCSTSNFHRATKAPCTY